MLTERESWQVFRVTADTWAAVLWLTPAVYARASRHRSYAAAARAVARLLIGPAAASPAAAPVGVPAAASPAAAAAPRFHESEGEPGPC